MIRSIAAVVSGFILVTVLSIGADVALMGLAPEAFGPDGHTRSGPVLLVVVVYVALFTVIGGYVTAAIASHRPIAHALSLGALGLIAGVAGTAANWDSAPAWYHAAVLLQVMPSAWLGGYLQASRPRRPEPA